MRLLAGAQGIPVACAPSASARETDTPPDAPQIPSLRMLDVQLTFRTPRADTRTAAQITPGARVL
jgi:hypothetical protein